MPVAMLLRSVPLIAMAPVIIMIFGRDLWTVAVIGGIVVLFPALVNISFGLKSASAQMNDLVDVYGGGAWSKLRKVAMPSSLPAFFAAVRISVPGAITGALLAEWLAVGGGIGGSFGGFISQAQFTALWASVVAVTAGVARALQRHPGRRGRRAGAHGDAPAEERLDTRVRSARPHPLRCTRRRRSPRTRGTPQRPRRTRPR